MKAIKAVKGLDWDIGAIGTAEFSGVRLKDVLKYAGGLPLCGQTLETATPPSHFWWHHYWKCCTGNSPTTKDTAAAFSVHLLSS